MYGQGSYNSQFGQGPNAPVPPPYQRQQMPGPPPLLPNFQQGNAAPPPSVIQPPGPPMYQHALPGPPAGVGQVPPISMPNTSQAFSTSHLGAPKMHHLPPSVLPHLPRPLPLPPPRPTIYSGPVHMQSQQPGGVQDLQRIPPPPPPAPTSSFFTSSSFGSFVQSTGGNYRPSIAPFPAPPPPSSPPPIQPSPPSSTSPLLSSMHHPVGSNLTNVHEASGTKFSTSSFVGRNLATNEGKHVGDVTTSEYIKQEGSLVGDSSSLGGHVILDLPPPPTVPREGKVVQKIEEVCKLIAKNGLRYEDMICQNESGNPEYQFLFAGDPGSEAAIAHEYYMWMKKKNNLVGKLNGEKMDSRLKPLVSFSSQADSLVVAPGSISPADSDMEMEGRFMY